MKFECMFTSGNKIVHACNSVNRIKADFIVFERKKNASTALGDRFSPFDQPNILCSFVPKNLRNPDKKFGQQSKFNFYFDRFLSLVSCDTFGNNGKNPHPKSHHGRRFRSRLVFVCVFIRSLACSFATSFTIRVPNQLHILIFIAFGADKRNISNMFGWHTIIALVTVVVWSCAVGGVGTLVRCASAYENWEQMVAAQRLKWNKTRYIEFATYYYCYYESWIDLSACAYSKWNWFSQLLLVFLSFSWNISIRFLANASNLSCYAHTHSFLTVWASFFYRFFGRF